MIVAENPQNRQHPSTKLHFIYFGKPPFEEPSLLLLAGKC
jgi:hypothetical protein